MTQPPRSVDCTKMVCLAATLGGEPDTLRKAPDANGHPVIGPQIGPARRIALPDVAAFGACWCYAGMAIAKITPPSRMLRTPATLLNTPPDLASIELRAQKAMKPIAKAM